MKNLKGFIVPLIIFIIAVATLGGGYYYYKHKSNLTLTNQEYANETPVVSQPTSINSQASSSPRYESAVPPNNLPEYLQSALAQQYFAKYFVDSIGPNSYYVKARVVDLNTFTLLPRNYIPCDQIKILAGESTGGYHGEIYLPNNECIVLAQPGYYAKDKNHVFAGGKILSTADAATFVVFPIEFYTKDKNYVWAGGEVLPGADPATFSISEKSSAYLKDKNYVWVGGSIISAADPSTFTILSDNWSKDKKHVYFYDTYNHRVTTVNADLATFQLVGTSPIVSAKDNKYLFGIDGKVLDTDPSTLVTLNGDFAKTNNLVFFQRKVIPGADATTFVYVGAFFKDSGKLYTTSNSEGQRSWVAFSPTGIDVSSFEYISGLYFKDKNGVYLQQDYYDSSGQPQFEKIIGADPNTFKGLGGVCASVEKSYSSYAKDKNNVYCYTKTIEGADPLTFEYVGQYDENPEGMPASSGIAKDKNCIYRRDKKVLNALGACIQPTSCTTKSLVSNPSSCGL